MSPAPSLRARCVIEILFPIIVVCPVPAEGDGREGSWILEDLGRAGVFEISRPIGKYRSYVQNVEPGIYRSRDGALEIKTNSYGLISEIHITSHQFSTKKLLRPEESTVKDVVEHYGMPKGTRFRDEHFVLDYEGFSFSFGYEDLAKPNSEELQQLQANQLVAVVLRWNKPQIYILPPDVEPKNSLPRFPPYEDLPARLRSLLNNSRLGAAKLGGLALYYRLIKEPIPLRAACLLNVYTRISETTLPSGSTVLSFFETLVGLRQDRLFGFVRRALLDEVKEATGDNRMFHGAIDFIHGVPPGFNGYVREGSFKTRKKKGGLQLTFFVGKGGQVLVDADIDERGPSFTHFLHVIMGRKAHPYDIHQILVEEGLNPIYALVPNLLP